MPKKKESKHKLNELEYYRSKYANLTKNLSKVAERDVGWMTIEELALFSHVRKLASNYSLVLEKGVGLSPRSKEGLLIDDDRFIGCDIHPFLKRAGWHYVMCDAENLPFRDSTFDVVVSLGVLHHLPSWEKGLGELARVLKNDGLVALREPIESQDFGLLSKFSKQESPHERPINEALLIRALFSKFSVISLLRVFPRLRMPITQVAFRIFPQLKFSKSFWCQLWKIDILCDHVLGDTFYLCRGAALLIIGRKLKASVTQIGKSH